MAKNVAERNRSRNTLREEEVRRALFQWTRTFRSKSYWFNVVWSTANSSDSTIGPLQMRLIGLLREFV